MGDSLLTYGIIGFFFCLLVWFTCQPDGDWGQTTIFFYGLLAILIWPTIVLYIVFRIIQSFGEHDG